MPFLKKTINLMVYFFLINFYFTTSLFAQNIIPTNQLSPEVKQKILEARQRAEIAFDFKTGHFKQGITDQERQQLYNDLLDSLVMTDDEYYRFDRTEKQLFIDESEKQKQEQHINELLDRCIEYIGKDDLPPLKTRVEDNNLKLKLELPNTDDSQVLLKNIQINYLVNKVYQCSHFLYGNYSLQDFEYYDVATPKTALDRKRQMLEPFYEDIYLAIRKVGLLRVIPDAYYPKSIVRESFRESQLNKYIKERTHGKKIRDFERTIMIFGFTHQYADWEASVKVLNHGQLVAIKFYNNREVWGQSITKFIIRNTNTSDRKKCGLNSIGVPVTLFKDGAIERRLSIIDMPSNYLYCKRFLLSDELIYFTESIGAKIVNYVDNAPFVGTTFKKNITEQEKLLVVNMVLDYTIVTDQQLYRLNRWEKSLSTQSEELRAQDLVKIKSLLIQCLNTIGFVKTTTEEEYYIDSESYLREMYAKNYPDSLYILDRLNSGLESLTKQCIKGLYGNNYNPTYFMQMNKLSEKQQQAEQFYIKAYLLMAKNELLRSTPSAFYPLSLVKEQAKESGFDEFLLKKEMEEKKEKMDYQKLLIEFYGSYKLWTIAVSDFISEQK